MKIAVLGATGPSGQQVVKLGLEAGYNIVALVRNPDGMTTKHDHLKVEKVDIMKADTMSEHLRGCDAVMSCLGGRASWFSAVTLYSESMKAITDAMRKAEVYRLVVITSWCTVYKPENPKMIEWLLKPLLIGRLLKDMAVMEDYVAAQEDIVYTFVRPPGLADWPLSEKEVFAIEGAQFVSEPGIHYQMPRANVAKFMLDTLKTDQWNKKFAAIGMKK